MKAMYTRGQSSYNPRTQAASHPPPPTPPLLCQGRHLQILSGSIPDQNLSQVFAVVHCHSLSSSTAVPNPSDHLIIDRSFIPRPSLGNHQPSFGSNQPRPLTISPLWQRYYHISPNALFDRFVLEAAGESNKEVACLAT